MAYLVFLSMGAVQLWVMVSALSVWTGSSFLAVLIAMFSVGIPLPWFLFGYWYFEGTLPWVYIGAWVVGWGAMLVGAHVAREH